MEVILLPYCLVCWVKKKKKRKLAGDVLKYFFTWADMVDIFCTMLKYFVVCLFFFVVVFFLQKMGFGISNNLKEGSFINTLQNKKIKSKCCFLEKVSENIHSS